MRWFVGLLIVLLVSCNACEEAKLRDTYYTRKGEKVVITPIKHASIQINFRGLEYEVDPVSSYSRPIIDYTDKPKADFIIVTNEHLDHFDPYAIALLTKNTTNILLPLRCMNKLAKTTIYSHCVLMRNGFKAELDDDVTVFALAAYNITKDKRRHAPKGVANGYILDLDGFRIYIAGDTELTPEMRGVKDIDIAFLPCDYTQALDLKQFREAARMIRPKVLYPYHYGATDTTAIRKAASGLGIDVRMRAFR